MRVELEREKEANRALESQLQDVLGLWEGMEGHHTFAVAHITDSTCGPQAPRTRPAARAPASWLSCEPSWRRPTRAWARWRRRNYTGSRRCALPLRRRDLHAFC